jgi:hypothetical protein
MEENQDVNCIVCRRSAAEWFIRIDIEDRSEFRRQGFVCSNCGIKLRLTSEKGRDLQVDPWFHGAIARVLRGRDSGSD